MRIHPSAYLSLFAFAPMAALAEGATAMDPATTPAVSAAEEKKVTYELEVGTRLFLMDSTNKKTPYFATGEVPLWGAMSYKSGVAKARLEGEVGESFKDNSLFRLRQAYAGVETPQGTEILGGRFTPEYIKDYGPFVLGGTDGDYLGFLDGLLLGQNVELGGDDKAFVQLFLANGLPTGSDLPSLDTTYLATPATGSRAYGVAAGADMMGLNLRVTYAMNPKMVTREADPSNAQGGTASPALTGDYSRLGFSLGYTMAGLGVGGFYESSMMGDQKAIKVPFDNGKIDTTGNTIVGKVTESTIGFGAKGTTELFGVTGVIAAGDAFTYGIGYEIKTKKHTNVTATSPEATKGDVESNGTLGVSVGYQLAGFSTAIGFKSESGAKTKGGAMLLKDADGKDKDSANSVQMSFVYNL